MLKYNRIKISKWGNNILFIKKYIRQLNYKSFEECILYSIIIFNTNNIVINKSKYLLINTLWKNNKSQ